MGNIINAKVTIKGTRPLFWNAFGPDSMPLEKQERTGVAGNDPEEWRRGTLATKDGQMYCEPSYIFGALRDAAKYTKKGKSNLVAPLCATLQIVSDRLLVDRYFPNFPNGHKLDLKTVPPPERDPELPVYLDVRGAVNPSTKGRAIRYRVVASPGWSTTFEIMWDKTIVSRNEMESVLIDAGRLAGIGNARKIGMGRFMVESFEIIE